MTKTMFRDELNVSREVRRCCGRKRLVCFLSAYAGPTSSSSLHENLKNTNLTLSTYKCSYDLFLFIIQGHSARLTGGNCQFIILGCRLMTMLSTRSNIPLTTKKIPSINCHREISRLIDY